MLNLNCVICAELFGHSDDVHVTHCGHMFHLSCLKQWMQRSKSCPQCRNKCTERNVFRVYFNLANLDVSRIDVGSLQEQLDNANLQVKIKEKDLNVAREQVKNLKDIQKKSMKAISGLEKSLQNKEFVILSYGEQLKMAKVGAKDVDDLRNEVKTLKTQIATMEGISTILTASASETERLLKTECDPRKLAAWVNTLKRELRQTETKKNDLRNLLKLVQGDLRRETERKRAQEEQISQLESENYQLNEKIKMLEKIDAEKSSGNVKNAYNGLNNSLLASVIREDRRLTISPTIKENVKKIEESNSPYLNIKSSSVGLVPLFKRLHEGNSGTESVTKTTTTKLATLKISPMKNGSTSTSGGVVRKMEMPEKLSIFKKPRLGMVSASASAGAASMMKPLGPNYVFNGFGGSEKRDPFAHNSEDEIDITDDAATVNQETRKYSSALSLTTSRLNSRLKSGGLRSFKVAKSSSSLGVSEKRD